MQVRCPHCQTPVELSSDGQLSDIACLACGSSFSLLGTAETARYETGTKTIGHFDLIEQIGVGTFGFVWKARDKELDRTVAIKIPRKGQLDPDETEQFLREARAAAQLRHPNIVSVHEVGRDHDTVFIVSDFVEGVTLADQLTARRFSIREAAELCAKIADALHHAHDQRVIHRDLKPGNIILDATGEPHIMDFGLARREAGEVTMTVEGRVLGTPAYMSPEQAKGSAHTADRRSDVYSLGVILFEMLTGERPFRGNARMLVHQVINDEAPSPRRRDGSVPRDLETICLECLEKEPRRRYASAKELAEDLRRYLNGYTIQARRPHLGQRMAKFVHRNKAAVAWAVAVTILVGLAGWMSWSAWNKRREFAAEHALRERQREVREELVPAVQQLLDAERIVAAFVKVREMRELLPADPIVKELWSRTSRVGNIRTKPTGARVTIRNWRYLDDVWSPEELTPLENCWLPAGTQRYEFAKEGYATTETVRMPDEAAEEISLDNETDLRRMGIPVGMVRVTPGKPQGSDQVAVEEDFFIDKFEVSNQEYRAFLECGGYQDAKYWHDQVFEEKGAKIHWQDAVRRFVDQTGKPGPATWKDGAYSPGDEDYPVRGVSWHEAVAYAKFVGKQLPTVYHWDRAASLSQQTWNTSSWIVPLSNFSDTGPASRGRYRGIGFFGTYDMAGNVKEWCWNELDRGRRWVRGGAWNEPIYMFVQPDAEVPLSRPDNVGFRCAKYLTQPPPKALAMRAKAFRDYRQVKPAPREEVEAFKSLYFIDSAVPLEPSNVSSDDLAEVIHETISVNSAHRPGKLVLHLFLPKGVKTPYQAIVYCPGAHAFDASSFKDAAWEWAPFVSNGRAVCLPTYMGMYERQVERQQSKLNWAREAFLEAARDARRAVDYLQSRKDIDGQSLAFVGGSWGATWAPIALAVEPRFKACVMITGGLHNTTFPPEVDPFNFAPQVVIPVLMLNGQYDWIFPVETSQEPLYRALGSKDKKIIRYESGHGLPKQAWSAAYEWLDEHFGLVARQPE